MRFQSSESVDEHHVLVFPHVIAPITTTRDANRDAVNVVSIAVKVSRYWKEEILHFDDVNPSFIRMWSASLLLVSPVHSWLHLIFHKYVRLTFVDPYRNTGRIAQLFFQSQNFFKLANDYRHNPNPLDVFIVVKGWSQALLPPQIQPNLLLNFLTVQIKSIDDFDLVHRLGRICHALLAWNRFIW